MKTLTALLLALSLALLSGCGGADAGPSGEDTPVELTIFAAASLTESLSEIAARYGETVPPVALTFTFESSGTLQTQIQEGAVCDLFLSAAVKQMDALETDGLLLTESRVDLLENQVVLAVPEGNPAGVSTFADLVNQRVDVVALGNADVPVGQYARELFTALNLWDRLETKITFGSNAKEVTAWVGEGAADCGVVYRTDAAAAELEVVDTADPALLNSRVVYPAAVLAGSAHADEAQAFLAYLQGPEAAAVFEAAGFALPQA